MLQKVTKVLLAGLIFTAALPPAVADTPAHVRKTLQVLYTKSLNAQLRYDVDGAMSIFDPDVVVFTPKGETTNYTNMAEGLRNSGHEGMRMLGFTRAIQKCSVRGDTATVQRLERFTATGTLTGAPKPLKIRGVSVVRDYWEKTVSGWLIKQSRSLRTDYFINGKLARHTQSDTSQ